MNMTVVNIIAVFNIIVGTLANEIKDKLGLLE